MNVCLLACLVWSPNLLSASGRVQVPWMLMKSINIAIVLVALSWNNKRNFQFNTRFISVHFVLTFRKLVDKATKEKLMKSPSSLGLGRDETSVWGNDLTATSNESGNEEERTNEWLISAHQQKYLEFLLLECFLKSHFAHLLLVRLKQFKREFSEIPVIRISTGALPAWIRRCIEALHCELRFFLPSSKLAFSFVDFSLNGDLRWGIKI